MITYYSYIIVWGIVFFIILLSFQQKLNHKAKRTYMNILFWTLFFAAFFPLILSYMEFKWALLTCFAASLILVFITTNRKQPGERESAETSSILETSGLQRLLNIFIAFFKSRHREKAFSEAIKETFDNTVTLKAKPDYYRIEEEKNGDNSIAELHKTDTIIATKKESEEEIKEKAKKEEAKKETKEEIKAERKQESKQEKTAGVLVPIKSSFRAVPAVQSVSGYGHNNAGNADINTHCLSKEDSNITTSDITIKGVDVTDLINAGFEAIDNNDQSLAVNYFKEVLKRSTDIDINILVISELLLINKEKDDNIIEKGVDVTELVNLGYEAKDNNDYVSAMNYFKEVLKKSTDINIKILVLSELLVIHKETGQYGEMAAIIKDFITRENKELNERLLDNYQKIIKYLLFVEEVLNRTGQTGIPYYDVPDLIKVQAQKILKS